MPPRIVTVVIREGKPGPPGPASLTPGDIAVAPGQFPYNKTGTLTGAVFADEVAAAAAVQTNAANITAITPPTDVALEVRRSFDGTLRQVRAPHVNLADVLDPVAADHSATLRAEVLANGGGYRYHIPDGMTVKTPLKDLTTGACVPLRDHIAFIGEGPGSTIQVTGYGANPGGNFAAFAHVTADPAGSVSDVTFQDLTITGDGPGASQTWTNRQAAAIRFLADSANPLTRVLFRRVTFRNHDGFPAHSDGDYETLGAMEFCHFENNGNGPNMNGPQFAGLRNTFTNCEGFECSGPGLQLLFNVFMDVFSVAISAGGNQNVRAYPSSRLIGNQVFGVRGGTGLGTGNGIITAESMPDFAVIGNYVERTYANGYQFTHTASKGPDDGGLVMGNHAVNCGSTASASRLGYYLLSPNLRFIGNRGYNRVALAGDLYNVTGYAALTQLLIQSADNVLVDDNMLSGANGSNYAVDINAATNIRWGINSLTGGSSGLVQVRNGATFANAEQFGDTVVATTNAVNAVNTHKLIVITTPGVTRNVNLFSAAGLVGKRLTIIVTNGATNTVTVTPFGTEQINGVNAAKTLSSNYASVTLMSDGTNWIIVNQAGTVS